MASIIPDQQLPRRTESGMPTRAINAAAGVLLAAMQQGRQTPTGLAIALDSARLLNSPETAAELERLRERSTVAPSELAAEERAAIAAHLADAKPASTALIAELAKTVRDVREHEHPTWEDLYCLNLVSYMGERMGPVLRRLLDAEARVAELETDLVAKAQDHAAAVAGWGRARGRVAELEARPADEAPIAYVLTDKAANMYPPALPWAKVMDADDLEGFLADLVDAASGDNDLSTLAEVEDAIARWRVIGEAQHAHNTAPGPNAEDIVRPCGCPKRFDRHAWGCPTLPAEQRQQTGGAQ